MQIFKIATIHTCVADIVCINVLNYINKLIIISRIDLFFIVPTKHANCTKHSSKTFLTKSYYKCQLFYFYTNVCDEMFNCLK